MKIVLDLPEWAEGRRILVIAGRECIADYNPAENREYYRAKEDRCSRCGNCCRDLPENRLVSVGENGDCAFLTEEPGADGLTKCDLGGDCPLLCCADPTNPARYGCSVTYRLVKVER